MSQEKKESTDKKALGESRLPPVIEVVQNNDSETVKFELVKSHINAERFIEAATVYLSVSSDSCRLTIKDTLENKGMIKTLFYLALFTVLTESHVKAIEDYYFPQEEVTTENLPSPPPLIDDVLLDTLQQFPEFVNVALYKGQNIVHLAAAWCSNAEIDKLAKTTNNFHSYDLSKRVESDPSDWRHGKTAGYLALHQANKRLDEQLNQKLLSIANSGKSISGLGPTQTDEKKYRAVNQTFLNLTTCLKDIESKNAEMAKKPKEKQTKQDLADHKVVSDLIIKISRQLPSVRQANYDKRQVDDFVLNAKITIKQARKQLPKHTWEGLFLNLLLSVFTIAKMFHSKIKYGYAAGFFETNESKLVRRDLQKSLKAYTKQLTPMVNA